MYSENKKPAIYVIIPAFNESKSIGKVISDIPDLVNETIVVNNASTDNTETIAKEQGATVLKEHRKGYGYSCLKGIDYIKEKADKKDIIVFLDGDYSDFPGEIKMLISPIISSGFDIVIGSRVLGERQKGSMLFQQIAGNWLATKLIKLFFKAHFTDLGPFRAITWDALERINMKDKTFGWTVEMQVKAAKLNLKFTEIPVSYRKRIGVSKVSGTIKGTILAGYKILLTIFKNI
jgi:glycosyltransferase involved in cell wall biosynthesis